VGTVVAPLGVPVADGVGAGAGVVPLEFVGDVADAGPDEPTVAPEPLHALTKKSARMKI
jgi:hypothetical protein